MLISSTEEMNSTFPHGFGSKFVRLGCIQFRDSPYFLEDGGVTHRIDEDAMGESEESLTQN